MILALLPFPVVPADAGTDKPAAGPVPSPTRPGPEPAATGPIPAGAVEGPTPPASIRVVRPTLLDERPGRDRHSQRPRVVLSRPRPVPARSTAPQPAPAGLVAPRAPIGEAGWDRWGPILARCESGGRFEARNPRSTASGAWQFLDSTWRAGGWAARFGVPRAYLATPDQQETAARELFAQSSLRPWAASRQCWAAR